MAYRVYKEKGEKEMNYNEVYEKYQELVRLLADEAGMQEKSR